MSNIGDGHSKLETPVLIPNTEVKHLMLLAVVAEKPPNLQAVFHILFIVLIINLFMKLSKTEARKEIEEFFKDIKSKSGKEIKKIKKLAMSSNVKLGDERKKFCKKCFSPRLKVIGVRNKIKRVLCEDCDYVTRWKIKS